MSVVAGTPRVRALAAALRSARETAGISARELARRLKVSQALVSHWENARRVPKLEDVAMVLATLGTEPEERERILDLSRNIGEPNWLSVGMPGIPQQLAGAVESERAASAITEWNPSLIPGLLQTPDYGRVVLSRNGRDKTDVDARMMVRMGRREVITRSDPVHYTAIIGESALRDPVLEPRLMVDQLDHLVEMSRKSHIELRVVPSRIGWHPGSAGPFIFYEFPDAGPVVYFEHYSSGAFVPNADNIKDYREAIAMLKEAAKRPEVSIKFIEDVSKEWQGCT